MKTLVMLFAFVVNLPIIAHTQTAADSNAVLKTLDSWNQGWAERNVDLAVEDYAQDIDWTNAFGDRFQGHNALKKGLEFIFSLDFVMAGNSGDNIYTDITFLTSDIALMRSKLVRKGQQRASGELMPDRYINHLRVLQRRNGEWKIVNHMISQAHEKR